MPRLDDADGVIARLMGEREALRATIVEQTQRIGQLVDDNAALHRTLADMRDANWSDAYRRRLEPAQ